MIKEIINRISEAEEKGAEINKKALEDVQQIERQAQVDIEELRTASDKETTVKIREQASKFGSKGTTQLKPVDLVVSKAKTDAAKKFIIAEFKKRYT